MSAERDRLQQYLAADQKFLDLLADRGVEINGVKAAFTPGKGRGIIADRRIKEGEKVVHIPPPSLLAIPKSAARNAAKDPKSSVHSLLTLKLLRNEVSSDMLEVMGLWRTVMPDFEILKQCIPLLWPGRAQQLLPEPAKAMLQRQRTKFQRDWNDFRSMKLSPRDIGLPEDSGQTTIYEAYVHAWLLINTRSFYWDYPSTESRSSKRAKGKDLPPPNDLGTDDCMALVPFIDLFNHTYAGESCGVQFNSDGFTVVAARDYEPGEEVFVTYGNHNNEFLLIEYGFMMDPNVTDTVSLDQYVIPEFNKAQRNIVEEANLFGNYNLHASNSPSKATPPTYCYRTQCALRALVLPPTKARRFITTGGSSENEESPEERKKIFDMWKHICGHIFESVLNNKNSVEAELAEGAPQEILLARWNQISDMVFDTLED